MKLFFILIITTLAVIAHARNDGKYHNNAGTANTNFHLQSRHDYQGSESIIGNSFNQRAQILRNDQVVSRDGSYRYQYETANGISGMEHGTGGVAVQGSSSYISPEGVEIKMSYTADESGYHPVGDHIPKIPDYILRSLEYIRLHPFKVIKAADRRKSRISKLSTEIRPPLHTPTNLRKFNYKYK